MTGWLFVLFAAQAPDAGQRHGERSKQEIIHVIKRGNPQIRECYERIASHVGEEFTDTKVVASWTIAPDGSVEGVTIDRAGHVALGECVTTVIERWRFPRPRGNGPVNVTFPWLPKIALDE